MSVRLDWALTELFRAESIVEPRELKLDLVEEEGAIKAAMSDLRVKVVERDERSRVKS